MHDSNVKGNVEMNGVVESLLGNNSLAIQHLI